MQRMAEMKLANYLFIGTPFRLSDKQRPFETPSQTEFLGFDVFIEQDLWGVFVDDESKLLRETHTDDIVHMMVHCRKQATWEIVLQNVEITLRAYVHPTIRAFCIGLAS